MKDGRKNIWVNGVMGSLHGMHRARAGDALYRKIEKGISLPFAQGRVIPLKRVSLAAACILLLLVLNVALLSMRGNANNKPTENIETVMEYYGLTNNDGGLDI